MISSKSTHASRPQPTNKTAASCPLLLRVRPFPLVLFVLKLQHLQHLLLFFFYYYYYYSRHLSIDRCRAHTHQFPLLLSHLYPITTTTCDPSSTMFAKSVLALAVLASSVAAQTNYTYIDPSTVDGQTQGESRSPCWLRSRSLQ